MYYEILIYMYMNKQIENNEKYDIHFEFFLLFLTFHYQGMAWKCINVFFEITIPHLKVSLITIISGGQPYSIFGW